MAEIEQLGPFAQMQDDFDTTVDSFQPPEDVIIKYRSTFNTSLGRDVLADIVCHAFDVLRDEGDMHRHNNAINVLVKLGLIKRGTEGVKNSREIVDALLAIIK